MLPVKRGWDRHNRLDRYLGKDKFRRIFRQGAHGVLELGERVPDLWVRRIVGGVTSLEADF